ncbi:MAG TPA: VCBS repeat-containing protein, partial [Planctomycetota bacterium]|nr:VCBS repeat-containing protein [Planctomycetota bacterium]
LWVFRNRGGGSGSLLSESPDWKRTFEVEVILGGEEGRFHATTHLLVGFHDVTGDGRVDLVTRSADDRLAIYPGVPSGVIQDDALVEIPIPPVSKWSEIDLRGRDLDGDGRADLVLTYGANRKGERNLILVLCWKPRT